MGYTFRLPDFDDLNGTQKKAVTEEGSVALTGGPGTGKSVVSIWRHISNYQRSRRSSIVLTFTKSLRYFLDESIISYATLAEDTNIKKAYQKVKLANSWKGTPQDEIIIDEAQDLPKYCIVTLIKKNKVDGKFVNSNDEPQKISINRAVIPDNKSTVIIDNIKYIVGIWQNYDSMRYKILINNSLNYIKRFSEIVSFGADDKQILYPERSTNVEEIKKLFPKAKEHKLYRNYRNTYEILNFVKHVLDYDINSATLEKLREDEERRGKLPVLKITDNELLQNDAVLNIIEDFNDGEVNIAVLVPFVKQVNYFTDFLLTKGYELHNLESERSISNYHNEKQFMIHISNIHITTFKSSKGLEFDVVIIPNFNKRNSYISDFDVVKEEDYYVAFTRTKRNLFLISTQNEDISSEVLDREKFNKANF